MPVYIKKRLSEGQKKKTQPKMWEGVPVPSNYPIKYDTGTHQYYKEREVNWPFGIRRTKVRKVWGKDLYRISSNARRFGKHVKGKPNKPDKIVTKEYGEEGRFRRKEVTKPNVSARKKSKK